MNVIPTMECLPDCEPMDLSLKKNCTAACSSTPIALKSSRKWSLSASTTSSSSFSLSNETHDHPTALDDSTDSSITQDYHPEWKGWHFPAPNNGPSPHGFRPVHPCCVPEERLLPIVPVEAPNCTALEPSRVLPIETLQPKNKYDNLEDTPLLTAYSAQITPEARALIEAANRGFREYKQKLAPKLQEQRKSNPNMVRKQVVLPGTVSSEYLEKRRKNNEAAKRSRDMKRRRCDELQLRFWYLKQDIEIDKTKLESLRLELSIVISGGCANQFLLGI